MKRTWNHRHLGPIFILVLALGSLAILADTPASIDAPNVFLGPITLITTSSLTVQGVPIAFTPTTPILGLDSGGAVVTVPATSLILGDTVTVYATDAGGAANAMLILVGMGFHLNGQVTALTMGAGGVTQVTIDGIYSVGVAQTTWLGEGSSHSTRGSLGEDGNGTVQIGSEIGLWGIADNGSFVAAFGRVESGGGQGGGGGEPTQDNGFILNLVTDSQGTVTGFTMTARGSSDTIVLDASTQINGKHTGISALQAGVHVKVWGTRQADGTVLASTIEVKGGSRH